MIIGYLLAIIIGLTLGLLGSGGGILTIPVLIYGLDFDPKQAIALSLGIIACVSLVGIFMHYRQGNVMLSKALVFASSASVGSFLGAKISAFIPADTQMTLFAIMMLTAAIFMFRGRKEVAETNLEVSKVFLLIVAFFVGILTGLIGVGGGFLIVPTLALLARLPMHKSVGTSLVVISINSFFGFLGHIGKVEIPYTFLFCYVFFMSLGIVVGSFFAQKIPQAILKKIFAIFLILLSLYVFYHNNF